jgi:hypothetical protein
MPFAFGAVTWADSKVITEPDDGAAPHPAASAAARAAKMAATPVRTTAAGRAIPANLTWLGVEPLEDKADRQLGHSTAGLAAGWQVMAGSQGGC